MRHKLPSRPARHVLACALLVVAVVLAACGGSNDASEPTIRPTPTPRPTATSEPVPTPEQPSESSDDPTPSTTPVDDGEPADPSATPTATPTPPPPPFEVAAVQWQPCGAISCATVVVPLDHADPQGPTIEIGLTLHRARGDRIGVLLTNPGGPGAAGTGFSSAVANADTALANRFDLIGWDPRGVGRSTPLTCGDNLGAFYALDSDPDTPEELASLNTAAEQVAQQCIERDGDLLAHMGTDAVVEDLELVRQALGEEKLNFMGLSYGTLIGALYAEAYGQNVRAMVLDGVVSPVLTMEQWLTGQAVQAEVAVDAIFSRCGSTCANVDPAAAYNELLERAERGEIGNGAGGQLTATQAIEAALIVLYRPNSEGALMQAIVNGDGAVLADLSRSYQSFGGWNVYTAVTCVDSPHPVGPDEFAAFAQRAEQAAPRFGADVANELLPCAYWPDVPVRQGEMVTAPSAPPILVVGNTGDTATPYVNAVELAASLETGVLLTHEGTGHTSYLDNGCVDALIRTYLIDLQTPAVGSVCQ